MWGDENTRMIAWSDRLRQHGLRTAILSNMGGAVLEHIQREHAWIKRFEVRIWSYQVNVVKPEPGIYHILLENLGIRPEEILFIDDKAANIEVAHALGINAIEYSTVERLRTDLIAAGLDAELPLPE
jgi:putative hydrolase of the HAD superfamily